jgi:hypothetical protein
MCSINNNNIENNRASNRENECLITLKTNDLHLLKYNEHEIILI